METVAVVGLGRVGLPLALFPGDRGHPVIGVEYEPAVLDRPSFEVAVQCRWPSVEKAGRLLGSRLAARCG